MIKNILRPIAVFWLVLTLPCLGVQGQGMAKDVIITLSVDVKEILELGLTDDAAIVPYCQLSDDHNGFGSDPKNFQSDVYGGKKVKWKGKSDNKGSVKIILIAINSTDSILFQNGRILNRRHWKMSGNIKNDAGLDQKISQYTIYFVIKKGFKTYGPYRLDPKLKANN